MKEGSVIEGIFAMYCALVLIDPDDGNDINKIKLKIRNMRLNTQLKQEIRGGKTSRTVEFHKLYPKDDDFEMQVVDANPQQYKHMSAGEKYFVIQGRRQTTGPDGYTAPPDFVQVKLDVTLKASEVERAYGMILKDNFGESGDFGKIAEKVDTLLKAKHSQFFRQLVMAKNRFLKNKTTDVVQYNVIADGIGGESSGGAIKSDVLIRIVANGQSILKYNINFSLKSDAVTVENIGLIRGANEVYNMFEGGLTGRAKIQAKMFIDEINETAMGNSEIGVKKGTVNRVALTALFEVIKNNLPSGTSRSNEYYDYLEKAAFGKDKASIVIADKNKLKQMTPDYIKYLRTYGNNGKPLLLEVKATSGDIRFAPPGQSKEFLFKLRLKSEHGTIAKMMLDVGNLTHGGRNFRKLK
jgi:hypothetical protein